MKLTGAKQQTLFLTAANAIVRALGLAMRVLISRLLGSEVMGIMELAQSVHMVVIVPLTSGLAAAISRLTALAKGNRQNEALLAGLLLTRIISLLMIPVLWLLSPCISRWMGDVRVLPSLWFTAPCILILGYSASYNGYCYGIERSDVPAFSELIEQLFRFLITYFLIKWAIHLTTPWLAALPSMATMIAEIIGLVFVIRKLPEAKSPVSLSNTCIKTVFRLSAPTTVSRLVQMVLRSATAVLIPLRLQASGLTAHEATARLGMLNGMVSPILMLPGVFTSALSMIMLPKMAQAEEKPSELGRLLRLSLLCVIPVAIISGTLIYLLAPLLANVVFRQADLSMLFRLCSFQAVLFPIIHLLGNCLSALGLQQRSMFISSFSATLTLALTWIYAGNPALRLNGVIYAQYISQFATILLSIAALTLWSRKKQFISDGKSV